MIDTKIKSGTALGIITCFIGCLIRLNEGEGMEAVFVDIGNLLLYFGFGLFFLVFIYWMWKPEKTSDDKS